jgi:SWI/SNF-related matrix-associated actin-dependent regulator of chromatin subfamily B protein 1
VSYHTDAEYHINLRNEADRVKASAKKRGGAAARQMLAQQEQTPAPSAAGDRESTPPPKSGVWVDVSPRKRSRPPPTSNEAIEVDRPVSPASSITSTGSERPLAQTVLQVNGAGGHNQSTPLSTPKVVNAEPSQTHTQVPQPEIPAPVEEEVSNKEEAPMKEEPIVKVETPALSQPASEPTPQPPMSAANTPTPAPDAHSTPSVNQPPAAVRYAGYIVCWRFETEQICSL